MEYLKNYNLSDDEINRVEQIIEERGLNIDSFIYDSEKIIAILDIFTSIGVTNIYGIITTNPSLFCDTIRSITERIYEYGDVKELAKLLNEDANNLSLIGML